MNCSRLAVLSVVFVGAVASGCSGSKHDAAPPVTLDCTGATGPDCLFDMDGIHDVSTLHLLLDGAVSFSTVDGTSVAVVPFRFTGAPWKGMTWTHRATLYLPDPAGTPDWSAAAIYAEYTAPGADEINALFLNEFGARTAAHMRVPVAVISGIPPSSLTLDATDPSIVAALAANSTLSSCAGTALDENTFVFCATQIAVASRDFSWNGYAAIAASYLRARVALLALDPVMHSDAAASAFPEFAPATFALGGYSKRGMAQWLAGAMEPSIAGVWIGSGEFVNTSAYLANSIAQWGDPDGSLGANQAYLATADGAGFLATYDPLSWSSRLANVEITEMRGTNDEIWPFDEIDSYRPQFPSLTSTAFVANAIHVQTFDGNYTILTTEALNSWRGFVGHALAAVPLLSFGTPVITTGVAPIHVSVALTGLSGSGAARVWWTSGLECVKPQSSATTFPAWGTDDGDLRDSFFTSQALVATNGAYEATLPVTRDQLPLHVQMYVDALDGDRFASTVPMLLGTGGIAATCP